MGMDDVVIILVLANEIGYRCCKEAHPGGVQLFPLPLERIGREQNLLIADEGKPHAVRVAAGVDVTRPRPTTELELELRQAACKGVLLGVDVAVERGDDVHGVIGTTQNFGQRIHVSRVFGRREGLGRNE